METSAEEFWSRYEAEVGERVLARTMGQNLFSEKDKGDWGLLVLTEGALRFRKTPGENWFASLFRSSSLSPIPAKAENDIAIPLETIRSVSVPKRRFLDFLFGGPFLVLTVAYDSGNGEEAIRFAVDPKSDLKVLLENRLKGLSRA
jgi:hypothetical protein